MTKFDFASVSRKIVMNEYAESVLVTAPPKRPKLPAANARSSEFLTYATSLSDFENRVEEHNQLLEASHNERVELIKKFKHDLEVAGDVLGNPKADGLFKKAWERGHANGFDAVLEQYEQLVDIIR